MRHFLYKFWVVEMLINMCSEMHHFDVNFSKFWRQNMNSLYVNLVRRIFSYKFSVQKTCIDYLKMHSECTILMQFLKKFPGEAPRTPTCGRGDPLPHPPPFGASRLSEAFGFIGHLCPPGSGGSGSALILFKNYVFLESDAVWLWRIGQSQKKIAWIVRRRDEPPRKYHCFQTAVER